MLASNCPPAYFGTILAISISLFFLAFIAKFSSIVKLKALYLGSQVVSHPGTNQIQSSMSSVRVPQHAYTMWD